MELYQTLDASTVTPVDVAMNSNENEQMPAISSIIDRWNHPHMDEYSFGVPIDINEVQVTEKSDIDAISSDR